MKNSIFCKIISLMIYTGVVAYAGYKAAQPKIQKNIKLADKNRMQFRIANKWLKVCREGRSIAGYLCDKGYQRIALYGMSYLSEHVLAELKNSDIRIIYGIDRKGGMAVSDIEVYAPYDKLPEVDAVIVCETYYFDEAAVCLKGKLSCPVVSLEEVVYES